MTFTIVFDLDGTITIADTNDYMKVKPNTPLISKMREFKSKGARIVIQTARNMRTFEGRIGEINIHTLPKILEWLKLHDVPYDEVIVGKPWCGHDGFYVDDRAIRPSEFSSMTFSEIANLLEEEKTCS